VDLVDTSFPVAAPFGAPPEPGAYNRVLNAVFENPSAIFGGCQEVFVNLQRCFNACNLRSGCVGVNVLPFYPPSGVSPDYANVSLIPWDAPSGATCARADTSWATAPPPPGTLVCFGVAPRADASEVVNAITISKDPADPVFYGTVFQRSLSRVFDLSRSRTAVAPAPAWRFADLCATSCAAVDAYTARSPALPARWSLLSAAAAAAAGTPCVSCDAEPPAAQAGPPAADYWNLPAAAYAPVGVLACDGENGNSWYRAAHGSCAAGERCVKTLTFHGVSVANTSLPECLTLAARDPECSGSVMTKSTTSGGGGTCKCYMRKACCKTCSAVPAPAAGDQVLYELLAPPAGVPNAPDPRCSRGVRSAGGAAGDFCCPASCGTSCTGLPGSALVAAARDVLGVCFGLAGFLTRPCTAAGPPCKMS
jgi:hypothetical protein